MPSEEEQTFAGRAKYTTARNLHSLGVFLALLDLLGAVLQLSNDLTRLLGSLGLERVHFGFVLQGETKVSM